MSKIETTETKKLAQLAHLGLRTNEIVKISTELGEIIKFVNQLHHHQTENLLPTYQVTGLTNVWRKDQVIPSKISRDDLLKNAPMTQSGYIKVKRVL